MNYFQKNKCLINLNSFNFLNKVQDYRYNMGKYLSEYIFLYK